MGNSVSKLRLDHTAGVQVGRGKQVISKLPLAGEFYVEHWRGGLLLAKHRFANGITNEGKDKLLNVMFNAQTQITVWYIGLIDNAGFTALAAGDIYDNINQAGNGWDEFDDYTDANNASSAVTRPAWVENAASSQAITNTTLSIYDITAGGTVKGLFVVGGTNSQTKNDHTLAGNFLWATALFNSGDQVVNTSDQLKVTYTVTT